MCITFIHIPEPGEKKNFRLVVGMNRDEFFRRPTESASWTDDLFGGWDKQEGREGGTWLACRASGHLALLTNIFTGGNIDKHAKGRGFLVTDYLRGHAGRADVYLGELADSEEVYNPFNLVILEPDSHTRDYQLWLYSRGKKGHTDSYPPTKFTSGTFGISNHPADQKFLKSSKGEKLLNEILEICRTKEELFSEMEKLLRNSDKNWPDSQIQKQAFCDGKPGPFESYAESLSSICLTIPEAGYGTRTHTIIIVDHHNKLHFKGSWTFTFLRWPTGILTGSQPPRIH